MRARNAETLTTLERAVEDREGWCGLPLVVREPPTTTRNGRNTQRSHAGFSADELGSTEYLLCHDRAGPNSRYPSWPTETNMVEGRICTHHPPISDLP